MSCPSWTPLLEHRFDPDLPVPAEWPEALAHLDGCPRCRTRAEAIDPTLIFRSLPAPVIGAGDIEAMKQAVHTLRTTSALRQPGLGQRIEARLRRTAAALDPRRVAPGWRVAAAAILVAGITAGVSLPPAGEVETATAIQGATPLPASTAALPLWSYDDVAEAGVATQDAPVIEGVASPAARVYSFPASPDEQVAVVMIIDPTLDV